MAATNLIVLTGLAGSGKTQMLSQLAADGESTLDLEGLARHRGSAFGGLGLPPQPTHAEFQRAVRGHLERQVAGTIWIEDEGDYVGSVGLPQELIAALRIAPCVEMRASRTSRIDRLVAEYGRASASEWLAAVDVVEPRLGARRADEVRMAVADGDLRCAVDVLLDYYDSGYLHRVSALMRPLLGIVRSGAAAQEVVRLVRTAGCDARRTG